MHWNNHEAGKRVALKRQTDDMSELTCVSPWRITEYINAEVALIV